MRPLNQDGSLSLSFYDPSDDHLKERIAYRIAYTDRIPIAFFNLLRRIDNPIEAISISLY